MPTSWACWLISAVVWLGTPLAWSAEVCTTIDASAWTKEQQQLRHALAYKLAVEAGQDVQPHDEKGQPLWKSVSQQVCFTDPTFSVPSVVNSQTILNKYAAVITANQSAATTEATRQQAFTDEVLGATSNDLCAADLSDIDARVDIVVNDITDLESAKMFLRSAVKKVARCVRARAR